VSALVLHQPAIEDFEELEDALLGAFRALVAQGEDPSIVVLRSEDVAAQGEPVAAALAHGLIGLVRALALEQFTLNALAVDDGVDADHWIERLADPQGLTGQLVRLDSRSVGRLAV